MKPFIALGSPADTVLTLQAGYRPLGAVVGVSAVAIGSSLNQSGMNGAELRARTDAVTTALGNARRRAEEQAVALGASGVVGVRVELLKNASAPEGLVEVRCVGTAVVEKTPLPKPFLSNLNGPDLLKLVSTGYRPVGLAVGFCFYTQTAGYRADNARKKATPPTMRNGVTLRPYEHPDFTDATYHARGIAMERLRSDARAVGAEGVVGVELSPNVHLGGAELGCEFIAVGTAVSRDRWSQVKISEPAIVVSVGDLEKL